MSSVSERCVLVVDDYADACDAMRRLITRMGYPAKCVFDGPTALDSLRAQPCAMVLLDLMMPGMSGFDVLREMRADPAMASVPVVVCSAAERATYWPQAQALGAADFLVKAESAFVVRLEGLVRRYAGNGSAANVQAANGHAGN